MRVICIPFDLRRPAHAYDMGREGEVEVFDQVSTSQIVRGLDTRRASNPVHVYLGPSTDALNIEQAVTILRTPDTRQQKRAPALSLTMELTSRDFWASVAFLSSDLDDEEEVALVMPDGISASVLDGLEPIRATFVNPDATFGATVPRPRIFRQGELLLWDWLTNIQHGLGAIVDEGRIGGRAELHIAIMLAGVDEGRRTLSRYTVRAIENAADLRIEIDPDGEPQAITGQGNREGAWDILLEPAEVLEDGGVVIGDGVRLTPAAGLHKRRLTLSAREHEAAGQGDD